MGAMSQANGQHFSIETFIVMSMEDKRTLFLCSYLSINIGYKKFQTVGLTGYHLLHLSAIDAEKGSKVNLGLACRCVRAILLDDKFLVLGNVDVRVQNNSALTFTFTSP